MLRALLLQVLYTVRSERLLMEELNYNLLFRWFVGLNMDDPVWHPTTFTKNRDRLLSGDVAAAFFDAVQAHAACDWPSAIRHARSVRGSTTSHHAIGAGRCEAGVGLAVLQSANLWGRPVTFFACTFAPGAPAAGTISEFSRKMARPAGFEPATLGLEGPTSLHDRTPQRGATRRAGAQVFLAVAGANTRR